MQKLLDNFKASLSKYWLGYVAIGVQFVLWLWIIFGEDSAAGLSLELRRLLFSGIIFTQLTFAGLFSLRSWWLSRDESKVHPQLIDKRINVILLALLNAGLAAAVFFTSSGRSTWDLEPFGLVSLIGAFYITSTLLLYRGNAERLWNYIYELLTNHAVGYFFGLMFWLGVALIFFALDALFGMNIDETAFMTAAAFGLVVVSNAVILTRLHLYKDALEVFNLPKAWQIFVKFVAFPLMSVYTMILLVYFATLLISGTLPENQLVSTIVALYIPGGLAIYLGWPLSKESKFVNLFYKIWLAAVLLISLMYFYAVYLRIASVGLSVERGVGLGFGVLAVGVFAVLASNYKHQLALSLAVGALIPVLFIYTPFVNVFSLSEQDQTNRLIQGMQEVGRLGSGIVNRSVKVESFEKYQKLESQMEYLLQNHGVNLLDSQIDMDLKEIYKLSDYGFIQTGERYDYQLRQNVIIALIGSSPERTGSDRTYFSVVLEDGANTFDLTRYSRLEEVTAGFTADHVSRLTAKDLTVVYTTEDSQEVVFDLAGLYAKLQSEYSSSTKSQYELPLPDVTFRGEIDGAAYELVVKNLSIQNSGETAEISSASGYLFSLR